MLSKSMMALQIRQSGRQHDEEWHTFEHSNKSAARETNEIRLSSVSRYSQSPRWCCSIRSLIFDCHSFSSVVVVRRNSPTAKFMPIWSRFLTLAASDPNLNPHHLADRPDRAPDMEALPGAVLCRGALRCHARPPGERSSNSFDRTVEASPPMRVTSPGHRPIAARPLLPAPFYRAALSPLIPGSN